METLQPAPRERPLAPGAPVGGSARGPGDFPTRPHRSLLRYYALCSVLLGPFFWAYLIPYYFRFRTLRYQFDDQGVSMRWGILFRREISLTYARIQDIHLSSNVVERWLGLARIQIQTASGSASAEMTIEGIQAFEPLRDFLYSRMRGAREHGHAAHRAAPAEPALDMATARELEAALRAVSADLRALREALARPGGGAGGGPA